MHNMPWDAACRHMEMFKRLNSTGIVLEDWAERSPNLVLPSFFFFFQFWFLGTVSSICNPSCAWPLSWEKLVETGQCDVGSQATTWALGLRALMIRLVPWLFVLSTSHVINVLMRLVLSYSESVMIYLDKTWYLASKYNTVLLSWYDLAL